MRFSLCLLAVLAFGLTSCDVPRLFYGPAGSGLEYTHQPAPVYDSTMQSKPVVQALYVTGSYAGGEGYNEDVPLPNPISPPPFPIFYNDTVSSDRPDDINRQVAFGLNYGISHRYFYASVGGSLQFGSYTPKARYFNPDPKQNYTALQLQMRYGATLPLGRGSLRPLGLVVGYTDEWGAYQDYRNNRFGDTLTYVPRYNPERWFVGLTNKLGVLIAPERPSYR